VALSDERIACVLRLFTRKVVGDAIEFQELRLHAEIDGRRLTDSIAAQAVRDGC
jgi:hypothetical protein